MRSLAGNTALWRHIRAYAVPPTMITSAAARRRAGDWAGACAASRVDVDLNLRAIARAHGTDVAGLVRDDLRHLAPDLLRWHMPRVAPDGLLRPALTVGLARYPGGDPLWLVARTAPAWADAGQRISLALWPSGRAGRHPHPHPDPRFRLDLHRHLWDARHAHELRERSGLAPAGLTWPRAPAAPAAGVAGDGRRNTPGEGMPGAMPPPAGVLFGALFMDGGDGTPGTVPPPAHGSSGAAFMAGAAGVVPPVAHVPAGVASVDGASGVVPPARLRGRGCAVDRWAAEAALLVRGTGAVSIRLGARERLVLCLTDGAAPRLVAGDGRGLPVLPDAAVWTPPDLVLLRAGLIGPEELHPLVAAALVPGWAGPGPRAGTASSGVRIVRCRGADHRIGLVDGVLRPLDHDADQIRREETLAALTGTPLPCMQAIDDLHRRPASLDDVRARLDHGDTEGALAVIQTLLGPAAVLPDGPLRDELEAAAQQRVRYGLYRAGLGPAADKPDPAHQREPRHGPVAARSGRPHPGRARSRRRRC